MVRDTTAELTPGRLLKAFSTALEHEEQCMPRTVILAIYTVQSAMLSGDFSSF